MFRRAAVLIATIVVCAAWLVSVAYADQFLVRDRGSQSPLGFIRIDVSNRSFFTDSQGRVSIDLPRGSYVLQITYQRRKRNVPVQIDGARFLKVIEVD